MKKLVFTLILFASPALAQQQPQSTPADAALQASSIVTQLGQIASAQTKQIEALNSQISALRKELEEAKKANPPPVK